jgi:hypothetical protein
VTRLIKKYRTLKADNVAINVIDLSLRKENSAWRTIQA